MADVSKINGYDVKDSYMRNMYANLINFENASYDTEQVIGKIGTKNVYRKIIKNTNSHTASYVIDSSLTTSNITDLLMLHGTHKLVDNTWIGDADQYAANGNTRYYAFASITSSGLKVNIGNYTVVESVVVAVYTK